jgi:hypothetical protein
MDTPFRERSSETVMDIPFSFSQYAYPLNPSATLTFTLEEAQEVSLKIITTTARSSTPFTSGR